MILMVFAAVFASGLLQIFTITFQINGLNRSVINTPIELMIMDVTSSGTEAVFISSKIIERLDSYYSKTLPRFCKEYETSYYFYNKEDESMCVEDYCDCVDVTVTATLSLNYHYERVMFYKLKRGNSNG